MSEQTKPSLNPNDIFELTRAELQPVVTYLGSRPAAETFSLLQVLLAVPLVRLGAPIEAPQALVPEIIAPDAPAAPTTDAAPVASDSAAS